MSKETAFIEMEILNKMTIINARLDECYSAHGSISDKLREVKKTMQDLLNKQQIITIDAVVKEARNVDLSGEVIWGNKSNE